MKKKPVEDILTNEQLRAWAPYMEAIKQGRAWELSMNAGDSEFAAQTDLILIYMLTESVN